MGFELDKGEKMAKRSSCGGLFLYFIYKDMF